MRSVRGKRRRPSVKEALEEAAPRMLTDKEVGTLTEKVQRRAALGGESEKSAGIMTCTQDGRTLGRTACQ